MVDTTFSRLVLMSDMQANQLVSIYSSRIGVPTIAQPVTANNTSSSGSNTGRHLLQAANTNAGSTNAGTAATAPNAGSANAGTAASTAAAPTAGNAANTAASNASEPVVFYALALDANGTKVSTYVAAGCHSVGCC